ncbi:MAG: HAMP domain-containing sensor histidine kinase [Dehalococcoidia bacterium]
MGKTLVTEFAPPERSRKSSISRQKKLFDSLLHFRQFADLIPDPVIALNGCRQIVFANSTAAKAIETNGFKDPYGLRPGEALLCEHAVASSCGCGTSSFCRYCGAVGAILSSLQGAEDVRECRITRDKTGEAFLFKVYTYPFVIGGENFSIFILKDISQEKRMHILEHIFFHDIKNLLTALYGWVDVLADIADSRSSEVCRMLTQLSTEIIEEVNAQQQLMAAESERLAVRVNAIDTLVMLHEIKEVYQNHSIAEGRNIFIDPDADRLEFNSDASLVRRVLSNMTCNALEAIEKGGTVTLGCNRCGDKVQFWVHNPGVISPKVQSQIFKWSFSTKGKNRGMGTYSMRLLSERYLGGAVSFSSSRHAGIKFMALFPFQLSKP